MRIVLVRSNVSFTFAFVGLIDEGFVTRHRRSKLVRTPKGERRVQDPNAYEVNCPANFCD